MEKFSTISTVFKPLVSVAAFNFGTDQKPSNVSNRPSDKLPDINSSSMVADLSQFANPNFGNFRTQSDRSKSVNRYLIDSLSMANFYLQQGKANESVRITADALLYLLRNSVPLGEEQLEFLKFYPLIGIELKIADSELKLVFHKQRFTIFEATAFVQLCVFLSGYEKSASTSNQISRTWRAMVVDCLKNSQDRYCTNIQGEERNTLCRILIVLRQAMVVLPDGYSDYFVSLCVQLSILLREPLDRTKNIVKKNMIEMDIIEHRRNRRRSYREIHQYRKLFRWRRKNEYLKQAHRDKRSRVIAAFHFGDFVHALQFFVNHGTGDRRSLVLRQQADSINAQANAAMELSNPNLRRATQLLTHELDPPALVATLRKGNTTLIIFCDLPREYGQVIEVIFLGRRAWFPKGPALIALVSKVPLFGFITYQEGGYNVIEINSVSEARINAGESLEQATRRLTQLLVNLLEVNLRRCPEQWRYLKKLPGYFVAPEGEDLRHLNC